MFVCKADSNTEKSSLLIWKATALKHKCNGNKSDMKKIGELVLSSKASIVNRSFYALIELIFSFRSVIYSD